MSRRSGRPVHFQLEEALGSYSPDEIGSMLASLADQTDLIGGWQDKPENPSCWPTHCFNYSLRREIVVRGDQSHALLALLIGNADRIKCYQDKQFQAMLKLLRASIADGGFLTSVDCERLGDYGVRLRAEAASSRDKPRQKGLLKRAEQVEKLGGVEVSATSVLMERSEGAANADALGDKPADYDFWCAILAAFAQGMRELRGELADKGKPAWLKDPALFAECWPSPVRSHHAKATGKRAIRNLPISPA